MVAAGIRLAAAVAVTLADAEERNFAQNRARPRGSEQTLRQCGRIPRMWWCSSLAFVVGWYVACFACIHGHVHLPGREEERVVVAALALRHEHRPLPVALRLQEGVHRDAKRLHYGRVGGRETVTALVSEVGPPRIITAATFIIAIGMVVVVVVVVVVVADVVVGLFPQSFMVLVSTFMEQHPFVVGSGRRRRPLGIRRTVCH